MDALTADELKMFVESVREYFRVVTRQEPQITSAFLATSACRARVQRHRQLLRVDSKAR
jgi:hypothetical protein